MKKRVGILTFHYCDSYGAVLQAFSLRKAISELSNYSVDIVNYVPEGFTSYDIYRNLDTYSKEYWNRREHFEKFLMNSCGLSGEILRQIPENEYDYLVVGSDQVWNLSFSLLKEYPYLLPAHFEHAKKIAYAPSIGLSIDGASRYQDLYSKYVSRFDAISVRERIHAEFIADLCKKDCTAVLDPTLLLGEDAFSSLLQEADERGLQEKAYVFFFWLHNDSLQKGVEFTNIIARKYHLKIVHNIYPEKKYMFCAETENVSFMGLSDFLKYIKNAKFVVTNSYHVSIFSIRYKTPMYIFRLGKLDMNTRIDDLVCRFSLEDRVVNEYIPPSLLCEEMDFEHIESVLEEQKIQSENYIMNALNLF